MLLNLVGYKYKTHTHKGEGNWGKYMCGGTWGVRVNTEESRRAGGLLNFSEVIDPASESTLN